MAAGGNISPKRLDYDDRIAAKPGSLLRRSSHVGTNYYYSSFDNSVSARVSACSNGDTLPMLASDTLESPVPGDYLEDSSDHEREDDRESIYLVGSSGSSSCHKSSSSIQAQDVVGGGDDHDQEGKNCDEIRLCNKEDSVREAVIPPYTLTCTLISSWAVKHCKLGQMRSMCIMYSKTSNKGHSERGQTSKQRTNQNYSSIIHFIQNSL